MKLSEKRRQAIYDAITQEMTDLRINLRKQNTSASVDYQIAQTVQKVFDAVLRKLVVPSPRAAFSGDPTDAELV